MHKVKIYHTLHSLAPKTLSKIQYGINSYLYRTRAIIPVTISKECQISYERYYNLDNSFLIENGRLPIGITKEQKRVKNEIEEYKADKSDTVFIHIARFSKEKNQKLLVDTFNHLSTFRTDFILLIIGDGFNTIEGKELKKSACEQVKFLGTKNNVGDYLNNSDAFCLTSIYEGLPISLIEALATTCIPICTPVGGIPNVIEHGMTGFLSKDITKESYLNAIQEYFKRHEQINREELVQLYHERFSMAKCASNYVEAYNN